MKNRLISFVGVGLSLALGLGCSSVPKKIDKPDVALQSMDIDKASLTDATVLLKLDVRNPNPFKINVDGLKYGLSLGGKDFASGKMAEGLSIAANSTSAVTVPVRMKYWDIFGRFSDLLKKKSSDYKISGTLTSGMFEFPFEHTGDVKLPSESPKS